MDRRGRKRREAERAAQEEQVTKGGRGKKSTTTTDRSGQVKGIDSAGNVEGSRGGRG